MPLKIYYVDDEIDLLEMFVDIFSKHDRNIMTFSNPHEATLFIENFPPDILFIDYRLQNCTGDEISLKLDPAIPKVLITGEITVKPKYLFQKIFTKPYNMEEIENYLLEIEKSKKNK